MTTREEFEAWYGGRNPEHSGYAWDAWQASRAAALEEAAKAVEQHDRVGREWAPGSFFGAVTAEAVGRIRALKEQG